ncbi:hypothetical protein [uncultured Draconibacterium sp.]|uniref:hypothetical protein n=1 Tax=uncultured Draconibacterium sp. TaxID=1573823 RepID=UPI0025DD4C62|nr:hypothetical protein [uncultured Draconibacterium sp.]
MNESEFLKLATSICNIIGGDFAGYHEILNQYGFIDEDEVIVILDMFNQSIWIPDVFSEEKADALKKIALEHGLG